MANLSSQQTAAVAAVATNRATAIEAVAGAGKTTTLIRILQNVTGSVAFCAFNKAIAREIEYKISPMNLPNVKVGTVHSFGFGAIRRSISRVEVDPKKLATIASQEFTGEFENLRPFVVSAAAMAKEFGIGACVPNTVEQWIEMLDHHNLWDSLPENVNVDRAIDAAQYLLAQSNRVKNFIDYADMIYLPILYKMRIWQYDNILLDEAQDTNNVRRNLIRMMMKPAAKIVAVGDPHQAIYGFAGADSSALDKIKEDFEAVTMPLSVSFRCPKAIIKVANRWVNHIEAAESAPEGVVDSCDLSQIATLASAGDAVICRNTKPLVELAYSLIRQNVACRVEGRSIGEGLIKLATKWKTKNVGQLDSKLEEWADHEVAKCKAKGNDARIQVIEDQVQTIKVFMDQCENSDPISTLTERIRALFSDTQEGESQTMLVLSTIHKAKGKEWNRVFALGMDTYSPSKYARQSWELEQEDNLCYVQVTRAKYHLTMVSVPVKSS